MLRALVVNPWLYDFAAYDLWSKPLGLLKIIYFLKKNGFAVEFIDCLDRFHPALGTINKKSGYTTPYGDGHYITEEVEKPPIYKGINRKYKRYGLPLDIFKSLIDSIKKVNIIFVGSGLTYWHPGLFLAIKILKERFRKVPIVVGGIYATLCFKHARRFSGADIVFKGSDLRKLSKLISCIVNTDLNFTSIREPQFYISAYSYYQHLRYVTLRTSYGCCFKCSYCGWYILNRKFVQFAEKEVVDTIECLYEKRNIRNFSFYDDALLYRPSVHFVKIFKDVISRKLQCNFHIPNALHCRFLTEEVAYIMKEAGFLYPRLGFESSTTKIQKKSDHKTTNKIFLKALGNLVNAGYSTKDISVNILVGLPYQSLEEVVATIEFLTQFKVRLNIEEYSPVPGSKDYGYGRWIDYSQPLCHNNTYYLMKHPVFSKYIQEIKDRVHQINSSL